MYTLTVNGKRVECAANKKLLSFLRDDLAVTSAKDGCSQGACGTCTVLVDGKATRACVPRLEKLAGKSVVTVEGLSQREKDVYAFAFAEAGAVQCGFCIPGMVISAKALLDVTPSPDREEVKKALRNNICRCTGYVKIEDAVLLAAAMLRGNTPVPARAFTGVLGEDFHRVDAREKVLGTGQYVDDMTVPGMLHGSAIRARYPRANVLSINTAAALAHPDCVAVLTAADVPGSPKIGHLVIDWDVMIPVGGATRYVGDAVALVVAKTEEALDAVKALVAIEYEELTPLTNPQEAMAEGAPLIHEKGNILRREHLTRGDADAAIASSAHVVTRHYSVPFTEHACMEPECALGMPDGDDGVHVFTGGQGIYDEQREIAMMLGIEREKVHITSKLVGGGFGGKEDMSVQHHAGLAAWCLKKPVKVKLSRQESIMVHPKRHAMEMEFTTACDANGILTGMKAVLISDTGAYASLGGPVLQRACTHAAGPYNYQNMDVLGMAVYTNNPPGGAFRGFGVSQSAFATECNLNILAEMVGISPWEIRYRNAIRPGQVLPNGQLADGTTALTNCLEAVKDVYESHPRAGIASSFKNSGLGVGIPDTSRCIISVEQGKLHARSSAACIGQGMATVTTQIICETLRIAPDLVIAEAPDTRRTPDSGTTTASRQTLLTGEATLRAAKLLKAELDAGKTLADLEGKEFYGEYRTDTDPMGSDKPNPVSHVAYGYAAQVVLLDEAGRVERVVAAYDVGRVVNPKAAAGQIEGGVAMGLGYALTEDYPLKDSRPLAKYGTLGLLRATEVPPIDVILVKGRDEGEYAYGAKGVGELATIPTAPAAAGAYYAFDGVFRTKLPLEDTYYRKKKA
ncbi:Xanthine dehydrogenase family protein, molybdopterin-binding subunit [uncultured delta proteobacterium]|uniref:Xanthine dehydrogenase family protein, molybdopterin-binding subunit n=1 Tax=uncultured delta proteobacterium TaxID=34034 RepID=A0A212JBP1_9DELT|nr:Xanthine dehydrogenase family protein, molybdopterin-binding subunit [uncultured delta proteobacterium]